MQLVKVIFQYTLSNIMTKLAVCVILLLPLQFSSGNLLKHLIPEVDRNVLVQCIVEGEQKFAVRHKAILISLAPTEQDANDHAFIMSSTLLTEQLSKFRKWSLILANLSQGSIEAPDKKLVRTIHNYIIYFRHKGELVQTINQMSDVQVLNPHANFLIVTSTRFKDRSIVTEVFETLKKYDILKAVLLTADPNNTKGFKLYGLIPFKNSTCSYNVEKDVFLMDYCNNGTFAQGTIWYSYKIPKVFHSCELTVVYIEVPPYTINMSRVHKLEPDRFIHHGQEIGILREIYANKTSSGALQVLLEKRAHIAIGGYTISPPRLKYFDCSFPYGMEVLVWVVPHERIPVNDLIGLASIIKLDVWLVLGLLFATTTIIIIAVAKHNKNERELYKCPEEAVLIMLLTYVNLTVGYLPKTHEVRIVFSMVLLFALILNAVYTTYLISVLANSDKYQEKYQTVEDIKKYNLIVYRPPNTERYFKTNETLDSELIDKSKVCLSGVNRRCFADIATYRNSAFLVQKSVLKYVEDFYLSPSHDHLLRALPRPVVSFQMNFLMIKGFWGFDKVNDLILMALDSGLAAKWMRVGKNPDLIKKSALVENSKLDQGNTILDFNDLRFVFLFVIVGYGIGVVVFAGEILRARYKKGIGFQRELVR
ncbi:uncharacterized protein [Euwallacea fornicatus]|uniref:uncharacterized protein isoform X2 n=1 Tax=Euwallacea fornicatus TaxID=995702 RepID=UPI003390476A